MVGKIPGLLSLKAGAPLPVSVPRAKGFDMGLVAVLGGRGDLEGYGGHEAHLELVFLPFCDPFLVVLMGLLFQGWMLIV